MLKLQPCTALEIHYRYNRIEYIAHARSSVYFPRQMETQGNSLEYTPFPCIACTSCADAPRLTCVIHLYTLFLPTASSRRGMSSPIAGGLAHGAASRLRMYPSSPLESLHSYFPGSLLLRLLPAAQGTMNSPYMGPPPPLASCLVR